MLDKSQKNISNLKGGNQNVKTFLINKKKKKTTKQFHVDYCQIEKADPMQDSKMFKLITK